MECVDGCGTSRKPCGSASRTTCSNTPASTGSDCRCSPAASSPQTIRCTEACRSRDGSSNSLLGNRVRRWQRQTMFWIRHPRWAQFWNDPPELILLLPRSVRIGPSRYPSRTLQMQQGVDGPTRRHGSVRAAASSTPRTAAVDRTVVLHRHRSSDRQIGYRARRLQEGHGSGSAVFGRILRIQHDPVSFTRVSSPPPRCSTSNLIVVISAASA